MGDKIDRDAVLALLTPAPNAKNGLWAKRMRKLHDQAAALPAAAAKDVRAVALREAIQLVGDQAVEILLRHKPDASPILKQATRQGITAPLRALLKEAKP